MGRRHYPQEYRDRLVELARSGRSVASLAEEFEPTSQTIRNWLDRSEGSGERDDSKELRKLRRELARIKEERDILAKATAWFAKETTRTPSRSSSS
jgi:transposase